MRHALALLIVLGAGCARLETNVRTDRGPVLQTVVRETVEPGGVSAGLTARAWPTLHLSLVEFDLCREQHIETLDEVTVTEKSTNSTGPSLSMGIANVLASGILFLSSLAVSSAPDKNHIDADGRYGPSTRQYVQGAGWVTLGIGVPSLAVGLISWARSGEGSVSKRVEQVAAQRERWCRHHPLTGPVMVNDELDPRIAFEGDLDIDVGAFTRPIEDLRVFGRTVALDEASLTTLQAVNACIALHDTLGAEVGTLAEPELYAIQDALLKCQKTGRELMVPLEAVAAELTRRREGQSTYRSTPRVTSFDEAMRLFVPRWTFAVGSPDVSQLSAPDAISGQAVMLRGVVVEGLTENMGVMAIGEREVFVSVPPREAWRANFVQGARLEGVGLVSEAVRIGEKTLPVVRALWLRPAF